MQTFVKSSSMIFISSIPQPSMLLIYSGRKVNVYSMTVLFCHDENSKALCSTFTEVQNFPMKGSLAFSITSICLIMVMTSKNLREYEKSFCCIFNVGEIY
jgi:hypothetical protein